MTSVYLAGAMRGKKNFNFPAFHEATAVLRGRGYTVISPAEHDEENGFSPTECEGMTGNEDLKDIIDVKASLMWDLEQVSNCDMVAVLPGSGDSLGTKAEIALANALGIPVRDYSKNLRTWPYIKPYADGGVSQQTVTLSERDRQLLNEITYGGCGFNIPSQSFPAYRYGDPAQVPEEYVVDKDTVQRLGKKGLEDLKKTLNSEVRTTSSTGGQKGTKLAQLSALDPHSLHIVAEIAGFGASKYSKLNFMKGYDWSLSYDALQRHLTLFWDGKDYDEESEMLHLGHAAWHCLALISFFERGLGTDDRYTSQKDLSNLQTKTVR